MDPRYRFLFHFVREKMPEFVSGPVAPSTRDALRYFKGGPPLWAQPPEEPPFPADPPPHRPHYPPLSDRERIAYLCMAIVGCVPFLLLIVVYILAHSPLFAN